MMNEDINARTKAEQSANADVTTSSQTIAKPLVSSRQVRKFKVEQNGDVITKYYWKKWFLFLGQWIPYHNIASSDDAYSRTFIKKIDDFIDALENR